MSYPNINFDRSEKVVYDLPDYPVYVRKGALSAYPDFRAESHWHDDIELIFIISGEMLYNVNGEIVPLRPGEGIFVNTRQLHFGYSDKKSECVFICVLFHPVLLCCSKAIEQKYIKPLLNNEHVPFFRLTRDSEWERGILASVKDIFDAVEEKTFELQAQRAFYDIWIALCENIISIEQEHHFYNHHLTALKDMITYINDSYHERLTLASVAAAGNVGKTSCCYIFKRYLNKTPNEFLTDLRLRKSAELLRDTDMTIIEVSYKTGFSGASYFTETFHRFYGCTPTEYRKKEQLLQK